jgi:uncharacterized protein (DUF736 family)
MNREDVIKGEVAELNVKIEVQLVKDLETMAKNSGFTIDEIVNVAIKRYRSSHADYMGINLDYP